MSHNEIVAKLALLDMECEEYPVEDWQYEVANDDTRQGYRDWLYNKLANEEDG